MATRPACPRSKFSSTALILRHSKKWKFDTLTCTLGRFLTDVFSIIDWFSFSLIFSWNWIRFSYRMSNQRVSHKFRRKEKKPTSISLFLDCFNLASSRSFASFFSWRSRPRLLRCSSSFRFLNSSSDCFAIFSNLALKLDGFTLPNRLQFRMHQKLKNKVVKTRNV